MPHGNNLSRLLIATMAAGALAAPAAMAQPTDPVDTGRQSAPIQRMDLRGEATTDTSRTPAPPRQLPGPPTWPMHPKPITPAQAPVAEGADDGDGGGVDAPIVAAIIAGTLALGGGLTVAGLRHRTRVAH
jgi:hypothetical protein